MLLSYPLLWVFAALAAYAYSNERGIPWNLALAVLPAFLIEVSLYFTVGIERFRSPLEKLKPVILAALLAASGIATYLLASFALGTFSWPAVAAITALCVLASFWYSWLPKTPLTDILFLLLMALPMVLRIFPDLYTSPHPRLPLSALGQLMWFRTGLFAMVSLRKAPGMGFGFWPSAKEWKIGALYFLALLPCAALLAFAIEFASPHLRYQGWERMIVYTVGTFFGILWVVALGEEFFFRGLLQGWLTIWLKNEWMALLLTALLFGSVHLGARAFPNWRFAAMAALAGVFYGLAFRHTKSIRASMVTHALTVTAWRVFFA